MTKKSPKRYSIVKNYLLKICDRGHHDYFNVSFSKISPEDLHDLAQGKLDFVEFEQSGYVQKERKNDWDDALDGVGRSNTAELISRDIVLYRTIEDLRNEKGLSIESAIDHLTNIWPAKLGVYLGHEAIHEIYKSYVPIFRFKKVPVKNIKTGKIESWVTEDPYLNFSLRDGAAYALREMMVRTGQYPIERPTGLLEEIHLLLDLPFENEILNEIKIYQYIRNQAFRVTFIHPTTLINESMGHFKGRFDDRPNRIKNAITKATEKYLTDFPKLVAIYFQLRLIEAEDNGQHQGRICERLKEDLENIG